MIDVDVTTRGTVSAEEAGHAATLLGALDRCVPDPVLGARAMLRYEPNPRLERPARAEAELDVNGRLVCARVAATTMALAIGELADRLERQLEDFSDRRTRLHRLTPAANVAAANGEWRHGTWRPPRPAYFPRPAGERELIRRKTFALEPLDPLQAVVEMLDLDHDFYLFRDVLTGADAVVHRREDGRIGLIGPIDEADAGDRPADAAQRQPADGLAYERSRFSEPITLQTAISEMDALDHRFMFFIDAQTGRGNVIYMRYDGNYGLIEPAA